MSDSERQHRVSITLIGGPLDGTDFYVEDDPLPEVITIEEIGGRQVQVTYQVELDAAGSAHKARYVEGS